MALLLCRELLSVSAAGIAAAFDVAPSGLSMTVWRTHEWMVNDSEFVHAVVELRERLGGTRGKGSVALNDASLAHSDVGLGNIMRIAWRADAIGADSFLGRVESAAVDRIVTVADGNESSS